MLRLVWLLTNFLAFSLTYHRWLNEAFVWFAHFVQHSAAILFSVFLFVHTFLFLLFGVFFSLFSFVLLWIFVFVHSSPINIHLCWRLCAACTRIVIYVISCFRSLLMLINTHTDTQTDPEIIATTTHLSLFNQNECANRKKHLESQLDFVNLEICVCFFFLLLLFFALFLFRPSAYLFTRHNNNTNTNIQIY